MITEHQAKLNAIYECVIERGRGGEPALECAEFIRKRSGELNLSEFHLNEVRTMLAAATGAFCREVAIYL